MGPSTNYPGMAITMNDAENYQARKGGGTQAVVTLTKQQETVQSQALRLRGQVFVDLAHVFQAIGIPEWSLELPKQMLVWTFRSMGLVGQEDLIVDAAWNCLTSHGQMGADLFELGCEAFVVTLSDQLHILFPKHPRLDPLACKTWIHLPLKVHAQYATAKRYKRVVYNHPLEWYAPGENPFRTTPSTMARLFAPSNIHVMPDLRCAIHKLQQQRVRLTELSRVRGLIMVAQVDLASMRQLRESDAGLTLALSTAQLDIVALMASGHQQSQLLNVVNQALISGISGDERERLVVQMEDASYQQMFVREACKQEHGDIEDACLAVGIPPADDRRMLQTAKCLVQKFKQMEEQAQPAAVMAAAIAANVNAFRPKATATNTGWEEAYFLPREHASRTMNRAPPTLPRDLNTSPK